MSESPTYAIGSTTALIIVDPQLAFGNAVPVPGVEEALENMRRAAKAWREAGGRVILTQHTYRSPLEVGRVKDFIPSIVEVLKEGSPLRDFHPGIRDDSDEIVPKTRFDATRGTDLVHRLRLASIKTAAVCGLTTPICVAGTVEGLMAADFQVIVIGDACASQGMRQMTSNDAHRAALARLGYIYAEVIETDEFVRRVTAT